MIQASSIEVCVFDAYGTLLDISAMIEWFRPDLDDTSEAFFKLWRKRQLEISWIPRRMPTGADFWNVTAEALEEAMSAFGLDDNDLRGRLMEAWLEPDLYSDVSDSLHRLREGGIKTAILSNGTPKMLAAGLRFTGLDTALDAVISVAEAGVFKPEQAVYKLVMKHFHMEPHSVCFVSGNAWDVTAAALSGFQVVWVNRTGARSETLPRGTGAAITTLAELPALLGA